jgi:hypothetical protein
VSAQPSADVIVIAASSTTPITMRRRVVTMDL